MAEPTSVNSQVTDAVTTANTKVLADAPAMALGSLYQTIGNSVALAAANAVYAQQQANVTYQAVTTLGVNKLFEQNAAHSPTSFASLSTEQLDSHIASLEQQLAQAKQQKENAKNGGQ